MQNKNQIVVNHKVMLNRGHYLWAEPRKVLIRGLINRFQHPHRLFSTHGFTLIELLVVVLIIGILAAVAVPQYQKAVYKSRAIEAVTMLKTLSTASYVYYLETGKYPTISDLSVNIDPSRTVASFAGTNTNDPDHYYFACANNALACSANAENPNLPLFHVSFLPVATQKDDGLYCTQHEGWEKTAMAAKICEALGGVYDQDATERNGGSPYYKIFGSMPN